MYWRGVKRLTALHQTQVNNEQTNIKSLTLRESGAIEAFSGWIHKCPLKRKKINVSMERVYYYVMAHGGHGMGEYSGLLDCIKVTYIFYVIINA